MLNKMHCANQSSQIHAVRRNSCDSKMDESLCQSWNQEWNLISKSQIFICFFRHSTIDSWFKKFSQWQKIRVIVTMRTTHAVLPKNTPKLLP